MTVFIVFMVSTFYFISLILIFNKQIKYVYQAELSIFGSFLKHLSKNRQHLHSDII